MVADSERAWHAGNSQMNARSIGIEHVAKLGDRITPEQSATSIALIRFLMQAHRIPFANIIPHVCVKPTSCCGDLFKDFGGGAGLSCERQLAGVRGWLTSNGIGTGQEAAMDFAAQAAPESVVLEAASASQRMRMAKAIVDFEARRDAQGRIAVYMLPAGDGGGRYEVAGINERYHRADCDELVALIRGGQHAKAEQRARELILAYTDKAAEWTRNAGIEFYLRDTIFNRGPGGAAWILQKALGVAIDQSVGRITLDALRAAEARPLELLDRLRSARESYERLRRDETSRFWRGLVNRWNKAKDMALALMQPEAVFGHETVVNALEEGLPEGGGGAEIEIPIGVGVPFIDNDPPEAPSFNDIGKQSPVDDPARMLAGIRAFRNNVELDMNLEVAIGLDTSLPASFLEVLATQRRAVGKISASGINYEGVAGAWSGTGFLIGPNILMTNHHVLNSAAVAVRPWWTSRSK